jgi:chromate transporter
LPSAILMLLFAYSVGDATASPIGAGMLHGLKLVAVAIVAQAVLGMARTLCPDRTRASLAVLSIMLVLVAPGAGVLHGYDPLHINSLQYLHSRPVTQNPRIF